MEIQSRQNCVHTKSSCCDDKCTNVMLYVYTRILTVVYTHKCHAIHAFSPWCTHTNVMLYTHTHRGVHTQMSCYTRILTVLYHTQVCALESIIECTHGGISHEDVMLYTPRVTHRGVHTQMSCYTRICIHSGVRVHTQKLQD